MHPLVFFQTLLFPFLNLMASSSRSGADTGLTETGESTGEQSEEPEKTCSDSDDAVLDGLWFDGLRDSDGLREEMARRTRFWLTSSILVWSTGNLAKICSKSDLMNWRSSVGFLVLDATFVRVPDCAPSEMTSAVRSSETVKATSPKKSPAPKRSISFPSTITDTDPLCMKYIQSATSPDWMTFSPQGTCFGFNMLITSC
mmetsp:Transcript_13419/g.46774  ORF Transcript_13419/g.46774 Transcript_13419/m.46774 type:complete len:200 (+) Transcript_13419:107-706(+)